MDAVIHHHCCCMSIGAQNSRTEGAYTAGVPTAPQSWVLISAHQLPAQGSALESWGNATLCALLFQQAPVPHLSLCCNAPLCCKILMWACFVCGLRSVVTRAKKEMEGLCCRRTSVMKGKENVPCRIVSCCRFQHQVMFVGSVFPVPKNASVTPKEPDAEAAGEVCVHSESHI